MQQLEKAQKYKHLCLVYGLALLNENCEEGAGWHHHYFLQHADNVDKKREGIEIILLELKKFQPRSWSEKKLGTLWLRFLKELGDWHTIPAEFENERTLLSDREERGFERGKEEGMLQKSIEVATSLIGEGLGDDFIVKATGLSLEVIQNLWVHAKTIFLI